MLASPLYPASIGPHQSPDSVSQFRPAKDIESFNKLLPPVVEFVEGSSSGTLLIAEGKYEPVNGSPKVKAKPEVPAAQTVAQSPSPPTSPTSKKITALFTGPVEMTWPKGITIGSGLINTGNSCFLNSALQCLLHTPPLLHVLIPHSPHNETQPCRVKSGFCMTCSLKAVMEVAHSRSRRQAFTPYHIANRLQVIASHMRRGRQEDSHEFLRYAIDALQKSCLAGHSSLVKVNPKLAETTWVHKIFGGKLRSRVACGECRHNSDTFDSILDLSVDIHGVDTLRDALRKFTAIDYLKGADKYKCEKCKRHVVASKRFTIHDAPEVLTIHLKRFSPLGRKMGHPVQYDERLSLAGAVSEGQYGPSYLLYGVISHAGGGPNSGHYYAHVKASNGQWYEMNDESVTRHPRAPTNMKNAYILFYMQEPGQGLQAAVTSVSRLPSLSPNGTKNKVKGTTPATKVDEVEKQPFIGPLLPSPSKATSSVIPARDPQADLLKRKIQAVSKPAPLKPSKALLSLSQYTDDDDEHEDVGEKVETPLPSQPNETPPTPPPTSSAPSSLPSIPPSQSYSSPPSTRLAHGVKRKSPDDDDGSLQGSSTTRRHQGSIPKYRFGPPINPFARTTSSVKNAMQGRHGKKKPII